MPRFWLDEVPVTQGQFLRFVQKHPAWRRDRKNRLFADDHYLAGWAGPMQLGAAIDPAGPVVGVSWFAAKAYCADRGARLPTEAEWEFAGTTGRTGGDGTKDPERTERILAWYAKPTPARLPAVGGTPPNAWGARDMVDLVWEWVYDFNSTLVSNDARDSGDGDGARFCGLGSLGAADPTDYATFMRMAMRSSLHADYTTKNLGFRCAANVMEAKQP
jgi:formylglycine-generating enzyme required for sulfatase activity